MTLCLASSLTSCPSPTPLPSTDPSGSASPTKPNLDERDQIHRYIAWFRTGYLSSSTSHSGAFDVGDATRLALSIWEDGFAAGETVEAIQAQIDALLDKESRCGNGSLMRCAPVGLVYFVDWDGNGEAGLEEMMERQGRVTHPHGVCAECCACYGGMIAGIMASSSPSSLSSSSSTAAAGQRQQQLTKQTLFSQHLQTRPWTAPILKTAFAKYTSLSSFTSTPASQIRSSGYVVHTLEAALWAFFTTDTFQEGALKAVNLGDDADTVGAVYGGLAGAYYGIEGVPRVWVDGLQKREVVDEVVEGVVRLVEARGGGA